MNYRLNLLLTVVLFSNLCTAGPGGGPPTPAAAPPPPGFPVESNILVISLIILISFVVYKRLRLNNTK